MNDFEAYYENEKREEAAMRTESLELSALRQELAALRATCPPLINTPDIDPQMAIDLNAGVPIPTADEMDRERQWREDAPIVFAAVVRWWNWRNNIMRDALPGKPARCVGALIALPVRGDGFQLRPAGPATGGPLRDAWITLPMDAHGRPILDDNARHALRDAMRDDLAFVKSSQTAPSADK